MPSERCDDGLEYAHSRYVIIAAKEQIHGSASCGLGSFCSTCLNSRDHALEQKEEPNFPRSIPAPGTG